MHWLSGNSKVKEARGLKLERASYVLENMNMTREDVYKAIDGERDYQDAKFGKLNDPTYASYFPAQFIIDIEIQLQQAKEANYELAHKDVMDHLRKIAALCVKCGEVHGMPERSWVK